MFAQQWSSAIQSTPPSRTFNSPGMGVRLEWQSERSSIENNRYALTGHIARHDATGVNLPQYVIKSLTLLTRIT